MLEHPGKQLIHKQFNSLEIPTLTRHVEQSASLYLNSILVFWTHVEHEKSYLHLMCKT